MIKRAGILFVGLYLSGGAVAHHSAYAHFDNTDVVDITGELTPVEWQNPHIRFVVRSLDENGEEIEWLVQERAATLLIRKGVIQDMFRVGDPIRIAGFRGRRSPTGIFATNILLADGREVFDESFAEQRWTENLAGTTKSSIQAAVTQELPTESRSIFRVWSTIAPVFDGSGRNLDRVLWNDSYPLTANARETQARWDPVEDNPYIHCRNGMPAIMDQIHPMEFREDGGDVLLHLEEQDIVRRIHMPDEPRRSEQSSPFGYSLGRWDGETLVAATTDIDWPWFDQAGVPQSAALELMERFTPSADGRVLSYALTATDPAVFTEPVTLQRTWIWVPGEEIEPYNCSREGDSL